MYCYIRLDNSGCPDRFIICGMDGPYTSASNRPTDVPFMSLIRQVSDQAGKHTYTHLGISSTAGAISLLFRDTLG